MREAITQGNGAQNFEYYVWEIALILLIAFLLGYLLRYFLNDKLKQRISDLEDDLSLAQAKSEPKPVDTSSFEKKIQEQKLEIDRLNGKLSDCYVDKLTLEKDLTSAKNQLNLAKTTSISTEQNDIANTPLVASSNTTVVSENTNPDDLKVVEGIGPKIENLLHDGGILSYANLANASINRIKEILAAAGPNYAVHDPTTWPEQAGLALAGKWEALENLKENLKGGKRIK